MTRQAKGRKQTAPRKAQGVRPVGPFPIEHEIPELCVTVLLKRVGFDDSVLLEEMKGRIRKNGIGDLEASHQCRDYVASRIVGLKDKDGNRRDDLIPAFTDSAEFYYQLLPLMNALFFRSRFPLAEGVEGPGGPGTRSGPQAGGDGGSSVQGLPDDVQCTGLA